MSVLHPLILSAVPLSAPKGRRTYARLLPSFQNLIDPLDSFSGRPWFDKLTMSGGEYPLLYQRPSHTNDQLFEILQGVEPRLSRRPRGQKNVVEA